MELGLLQHVELVAIECYEENSHLKYIFISLVMALLPHFFFLNRSSERIDLKANGADYVTAMWSNVQAHSQGPGGATAPAFPGRTKRLFLAAWH